MKLVTKSCKLHTIKRPILPPLILPLPVLLGLVWTVSVSQTVLDAQGLPPAAAARTINNDPLWLTPFWSWDAKGPVAETPLPRLPAKPTAAPAPVVAPGSQPLGALMTYINPQIGVPTLAPYPVQAQMRAMMATNMAYSTSSSNLTVVTNPHGGFTVNLQGRFQSATTATVDPKGRVTIR